MESTITDLINRRSIKKFKPEQIKDEELNKILEAGTYAPTGMGLQSPKIVVIQNKETRDKLSKLNANILSPGRDFDPFYGAPTVIVVLADKNIGTHLEDASLVLGNLLNAASAIGVGGCWIHRAKEEFNSEEGKALLKEWNIPDNYVGVGHCILGYADESFTPANKPRKEDYITIIR